MIPTDPYHERLAAERAAIIREYETRYEGCADHTVGPYPVDETEN